MKGARALDGVAGFVEAPRFYPYLSGRKNLELVAALDGDGAAGRIGEALDTVDLADRAKHKVGGYSHGMRQRLGIAGALLRAPRLLLLDEPTTGLDPAGMRDMRALIRRLADQGITVLLSSHLMAEVEELCDRVAIIGSGRVLYEGALDELIASTSGRYELRTTDDIYAMQIATRYGEVAEKPGAAQLQRRRAGGGRVVDRARPRRRRHHRARPAAGHTRGAVLPHDRRALHERPRQARGGGAVSAVAVPLRTRRPGVGAVYRWELRKLAAQKRTYIGLASAVAVPLIFVIALVADNSGGGPDGLPFASYVRDTGFAVPLVCLAFGAFWFLPLITALVAGDIVAAEDNNGTLKTILTRSVERWHVFAGKVLAALTYTAAVLLLYVGVALVAGGLIWGFDPLTSLSGTTITSDRALLLTGAGTLAYLLPMSAIAAIGILLSTVTRNSAAAVVGTLMVSIFVQIIGSISALDALDPYLLSTQFNAWQGILREPTDWAPIVRSAWVCGLYALPAVFCALTVFLRRDVTGG